MAGAAVSALHVSVSSFHLKFARGDPDADDAPDLTETDPGACPTDPGAGGVSDSVGGDDASDSHAVLAVAAVAVCVGCDTDRQVYNIFQILCFV